MASEHSTQSHKDFRKHLEQEASTNDDKKMVTDGFGVLNFIDFGWDLVSPTELSGRFVVSSKLCQPFGVLHGGVTAFLAEALASIGAQFASNWARVAGVDLTVSHLLAVPFGAEVIVKATALRVGKRLQVWDVKFTMPVKQQAGSTAPMEFATTAVARLTLLVGLPDADKASEGNAKVIALARKNSAIIAPGLSKL